MEIASRQAGCHWRSFWLGYERSAGSKAIRGFGITIRLRRARLNGGIMYALIVAIALSAAHPVAETKDLS
ncbi:MAG TPA: hypothetical protein VK636_07775, partial [Gemmatimonadaceae bacterium]|nr:hypothetical protein [Gemmatimonadaceae bacterium]